LIITIQEVNATAEANPIGTNRIKDGAMIEESHLLPEFYDFLNEII
jgi:hypothetical protein